MAEAGLEAKDAVLLLGVLRGPAVLLLNPLLLAVETKASADGGMATAVISKAHAVANCLLLLLLYTILASYEYRFQQEI